MQISWGHVIPTEALMKVVCAQLINLGVLGPGTQCPLLVACDIIHEHIFVGRRSIASTDYCYPST